MPYLDKTLLGDPEPYKQEVIISEDIDSFLHSEGFDRNYYHKPRPRFQRYVINSSKLYRDLILVVYEDHCECAVDGMVMHDFRFDKNNYQDFIQHYIFLINKLAEYYKK